MYEYIKNNDTLKEVKKACENLIKEIQRSGLKEYFTFQFNLIGSGSTNLITYNGDNEEYDLDYNFILQKDKKNIFSNPKKIKELFIKYFNEVNPKLGFNDAENSTSVITSKLTYNNKIIFSFDVAILCEGYNGNYLKIKYNKKTDQYYWNEIKSSRNYQSKIKKLKDMGKWNDVRELYLEKKNLHLKQQKYISSFSVLLETLNELCSKNGINL